MKSKFGLSSNGWDIEKALRVTSRSPRKFISSCLEEFHKHGFKVGDEQRIRFWKDIWISNSIQVYRFPMLYRLAESKEKKKAFPLLEVLRVLLEQVGFLGISAS